MVAIATARSTNAAAGEAAATGDDARPFVAVFTGGTSGIGERALRALAKRHGPASGPNRRPLRVYIVGRKPAAAEALIADCAAACPGGEFVFVKTGDLALLADNDAAAAEITRLEKTAAAKEGHEAKIDLYVATQGVLYFGPRIDTAEGIDRHLSLMYYSRLRLVTKLLPLLTAAAGPPARVVSVLNPNLEGKLVATDLSLRDPKNFGFGASTSHVALFTTFAFERLAAEYPARLSLCHYYPGLVMTDVAANSPIPHWASLAWKVFAPISRLFAVGDEDCGQYIVFMSSAAGRFVARSEAAKQEKPPKGLEVAVGADGAVGSGAYRVNWNGDIIAPKKETDGYRRDGVVDKVWQHTMAAFAAVDAGKAFEG